MMAEPNAVTDVASLMVGQVQSLNHGKGLMLVAVGPEELERFAEGDVVAVVALTTLAIRREGAEAVVDAAWAARQEAKGKLEVVGR